MNLNIDLLYFLNRLTSISGLVSMICVFLSGIFAFAIFPIFFVYYAYTHVTQRMYFFALIFSTLLTTWLLAEGIKRIIKIPRPYITHNTIHTFTHSSGYSFPSEHAAVYSALAFLAFSIDIRLGIITTVVAFLIGISRINLGVHYPIDVVTGWIVGILVAILFTHFFKTYLW